MAHAKDQAFKAKDVCPKNNWKTRQHKDVEKFGRPS
jgi:hypothetical protein